MHKSFSSLLYRFLLAIIKKFIALTSILRCRPLGLALGTMILEFHQTIQTVKRRLRFRASPKKYGFNQFQPKHKGLRPLLLIHGRMGRWADLAEMAQYLSAKGFPVFLINLKRADRTTALDRERILRKVERIRFLYKEMFNEAPPQVDIIGHSMGGLMALYASFCSSNSYIDTNSFCKFKCLNFYPGERPKRSEGIGKVITLGMPTHAFELKWARIASKDLYLYNILARYDAVVPNHKCGLIDESPSHVKFVDTGHLGILNEETFKQVKKWLLGSSLTPFSSAQQP